MPRSRIRLKDRLPNAPPHFAGRDSESEWLQAALGRGNVAMITGPAGIGKTALVLGVLHRFFPDAVANTLYIQVPEDEPAEQLLYDLLKVIAAAAREQIDLAALAHDTLALVEATIDLAESSGVWVVLDDVHHVDSSAMNEVLMMLASYARTSRWIVTSRSSPHVPNLKGQTLALDAMGEADLLVLARSLEPGRDDSLIRQAVAACGGSPWLLTQSIVTGALGPSPSRERVLRGLEPGLERFLSVLAVLRFFVPIELLAQLGHRPSEDEIQKLERRGLIVRQGDAVRIHQAMAALFAPDERGSSSEEIRKRAATLLEASDMPERIVEAARQLSAAGDMEAVLALLNRHAERLFAEAQAPRLWAVIRDLRDSRLTEHQMRCAAELGNPTALNVVPAPLDQAESLAWARTLYARGKIAEAAAAATEIAAAAARDGDGDSEAESRLLIARCWVHTGRFEEALAELHAFVSDHEEVERRQAALVLHCEAASGGQDVYAQTAKLYQKTGLSEVAALYDIARTLYLLDHRKEANDVVDRLRATPRGGRTSHLFSRKVLLLKARILLDFGLLREAESLLLAVKPYVRTASLLRSTLTELRTTHGLLMGAFAGARRELDVSLREDARFESWADGLNAHAQRLALLLGGEPPPTDPTLRAARVRLRHGPVSSEPVIDELDASAGLESLMWFAESLLLQGDAAGALRRAREALTFADRAGVALGRFEACCCYLDVLLATDHESGLREHLSTLRQWGEELGSARVASIVEFCSSFERAEVLERCAAQNDIAPVVARRARFLLDPSTVVDRIDGLVLRGIGRHLGEARVMTVAAASDARDWVPGWGLDEVRQVAWTSTRVVDLSKKGTLRRLLQVLIEKREASKATLVRDVWEERIYHPGRHDPRVHMSIRKLRELLEDEPSEPTRVLTSEDGYRLGGVIRRVRRVP